MDFLQANSLIYTPTYKKGKVVPVLNELSTKP
jgi:hypothetical protein